MPLSKSSYTGLWIIEDDYREQPEVWFKHQLILQLQLRSRTAGEADRQLVWSTFANYNRLYQDSVRMPVVKVQLGVGTYGGNEGEGEGGGWRGRGKERGREREREREGKREGRAGSLDDLFIPNPCLLPFCSRAKQMTTATASTTSLYLSSRCPWPMARTWWALIFC